MIDSGPLSKVADGQRLAIAVVVLVAMWATCWLLVVIWLVASMGDFDTGANSGQRQSTLAGVGAVVSLLASGPVAYWIGRRRWLLAAPVALLAVWGAGVAAAAAT